MAQSRPFALVRTVEQWVRCAHQHTTVDLLEGVVSLVDLPPEKPAPLELGAATGGAGLAFDAHCRLYHSLPAANRLDKQLWADRSARALPLLEGLATPRGLAVDAAQQLWIAQAGLNALVIFSLFDSRVVRTVPLGDPVASGPKPLDVVALGHRVYAVTTGPAGWLQMTSQSPVHWHPFRAESGVLAPSRLGVSEGGTVVILDQPGTAAATLHRLRVEHAEQPGEPQVEHALAVPFATDVKFQGLFPQKDSGRELEVFVVARATGPSSSFLRVAHTPAGFDLLPGALRAPGYDGQGIVLLPAQETGRRSIGYWSPQGLRLALQQRRAFERSGRVAVFRLDADDFQTRWGRLFLDACIPAETSVRVRVLALDELPEDAALWPYTPPAGVIPDRPELTPPLPPTELIERSPAWPLHRREFGPELPWVRFGATDAFETYELPVRAEPGRFLWVVLELEGNGKATPRIRSMRVEKPGHALLRRLPKVFSRDPTAGDFLQRLLAPLDGLLSELEGRAAMREVLVAPDATPAELLPWLASFVGLVMDQRWDEAVRRAFVREAVRLFKQRGTLAGLRRMLFLALGVEPVLLEHYRLRGVGGGSAGGTTASSIIGVGLRAGGALGALESVVAGEVDDAFATHAHRFSVFLPLIGREAIDTARFILDAHRPAHTVYDLCTLENGMRVGVGLHLGLNSFVGPSGGFGQLQLDGSILGRSSLVGHPGEGFRLGSDRVGGGR